MIAPLGQRLLARHGRIAHATGAGLARSVTERHRPAYVQAATRLAVGRTLSRAIGSPPSAAPIGPSTAAGPQGAAPQEQEGNRPDYLSPFAANVLFGDGKFHDTSGAVYEWTNHAEAQEIQEEWETTQRDREAKIARAVSEGRIPKATVLEGPADTASRQFRLARKPTGAAVELPQTEPGGPAGDDGSRETVAAAEGAEEAPPAEQPAAETQSSPETDSASIARSPAPLEVHERARDEAPVLPKGVLARQATDEEAEPDAAAPAAMPTFGEAPAPAESRTEDAEAPTLARESAPAAEAAEAPAQPDEGPKEEVAPEAEAPAAAPAAEAAAPAADSAPAEEGPAEPEAEGETATIARTPAEPGRPVVRISRTPASPADELPAARVSEAQRPVVASAAQPELTEIGEGPEPAGPKPVPVQVAPAQPSSPARPVLQRKPAEPPPVVEAPEPQAQAPSLDQALEPAPATADAVQAQSAAPPARGLFRRLADAVLAREPSSEHEVEDAAEPEQPADGDDAAEAPAEAPLARQAVPMTIAEPVREAPAATAEGPADDVEEEPAGQSEEAPVLARTPTPTLARTPVATTVAPPFDAPAPAAGAPELPAASEAAADVRPADPAPVARRPVLSAVARLFRATAPAPAREAPRADGSRGATTPAPPTLARTPAAGTSSSSPRAPVEPVRPSVARTTTAATIATPADTSAGPPAATLARQPVETIAEVDGSTDDEAPASGDGETATLARTPADRSGPVPVENVHVAEHAQLAREPAAAVPPGPPLGGSTAAGLAAATGAHLSADDDGTATISFGTSNGDGPTFTSPSEPTISRLDLGSALETATGRIGDAAGGGLRSAAAGALDHAASAAPGPLGSAISGLSHGLLGGGGGGGGGGGAPSVEELTEKVIEELKNRALLERYRMGEYDGELP